MLWRPVFSLFVVPNCSQHVRSPCMCSPCLYAPELIALHVYSHHWEWFLIRHWEYYVTKWAIKTPYKNELYIFRRKWAAWKSDGIHDGSGMRAKTWVKPKAKHNIRTSRRWSWWTPQGAGRCKHMCEPTQPSSRSHLWSAKKIRSIHQYSL